ncbi:MAG: hypothetical protein V4808_13935 [Pseudomonadota bacterium]
MQIKSSGQAEKKAGKSKGRPNQWFERPRRGTQREEGAASLILDTISSDGGRIVRDQPQQPIKALRFFQFG